MFNVVDLEHFDGKSPCVRCGFDLAPLAIPEPVVCTLCQEICYNPCRKGKTENTSGSITPCHARVTEPFAVQR